MRTADGGELAGASPPAGRADGGSPVGSERTEVRKRQMPAAQETTGPAPGQHGAGSRGSNACCFCWCCCCSCSCLTVRNQEEQRPRRASHELRREDLPTCEESPSPTLEEVSAWAQSFDKVMLTPAGRNAFREFLRTEFSEENMLFWMACEELKKEANKTVIEEKARTIYEDYISILSPKEPMICIKPLLRQEPCPWAPGPDTREASTRGLPRAEGRRRNKLGGQGPVKVLHAAGKMCQLGLPRKRSHQQEHGRALPTHIR
uniref:RGS domain-containing protein n=1 Tax=Felis catus TaxID=9685 RepID=A0ABI7Y0S7_FELCA